MIDTKLILLDGLPGSGKTTTSQKVYDRIDNKNKFLFQEYINSHPINEWEIEDINEWGIKTLDNWKKLSDKIFSEDHLYVMEYVLFQNTIAEMLLKGCNKNQISNLCLEIQNIIMQLSPVLILYSSENTNVFLKGTYDLRKGNWQKKIDSFIDNTEYGRSNNLRGLEGYLSFSNEYVSIRDDIYSSLEIRKIEIDVTDRNWDKIEQSTYSFLGI